MMYTLWTTRNKMVIERVFQRHVYDSFFKFFAFLQRLHPLVRPRDRDRLQLYLDALLTSTIGSPSVRVRLSLPLWWSFLFLHCSFGHDRAVSPAFFPFEICSVLVVWML